MKLNTLSILIFVLTISLVLNEEVTRKQRNRNTMVKVVKRLIYKISKNNYTYSMEDIDKISELNEKVSKGSLNRTLKKKLIRVLSKVKRILLQNIKQNNQGMMRLGRKEIQQLKKVLRMLNLKKRNNNQRKNNLRRSRKRYNKKNNRASKEREKSYDDRRGQDKESLKEYVDKKVEKEVRKKLSKEIKNRRKNRKHLRRIKQLKRKIHHIRNNSNNECKDQNPQTNHNNYNSNYNYQKFNQNNQPNCDNNNNNSNYNTNNNNYSGNNNILPPSSTNIIAAVPILPVPLPHPITTEIASSPSQGLVQVTKEIPTGIIQETKAILL